MSILRSRLFWIAVVVVVIAALLPFWLSAYLLGILTAAYYFGRHGLGFVVRLRRRSQFRPHLLDRGWAPTRLLFSTPTTACLYHSA